MQCFAEVLCFFWCRQAQLWQNCANLQIQSLTTQASPLSFILWMGWWRTAHNVLLMVTIFCQCMTRENSWSKSGVLRGGPLSPIRWLQLWTKMVATTMMTSISGAQGKSLSLPRPWAGYYCPSEIFASHLWLQYLSPHLLYYFTDIVHYFYPFIVLDEIWRDKLLL